MSDFYHALLLAPAALVCLFCATKPREQLAIEVKAIAVLLALLVTRCRVCLTCYKRFLYDPFKILGKYIKCLSGSKITDVSAKFQQLVPIHISMQTIHRLKRLQELLEQLDPQAPPQALIVPDSPVPRGTVIVFPGSFNPPTTAHLALMKQARDVARFQAWSTGKQETVHLYAAISKHIVDKESVERPLLIDRILLLDKLLRRRFSHAGILLFNRGLYIEQAQAVHTSFPRVNRLLFLVGFDKIVQILDPHYYDDRDASLNDLFALAELLVAPRGNEGKQSLDELLQRPENRPFAHYIHALPFDPAYRQISSTRVRQNGSRGEVPHEVQCFMSETRAYAPPLRLPDGTEIDVYAERVKLLEKLLKNDSTKGGLPPVPF